MGHSVYKEQDISSCYECRKYTTVGVVPLVRLSSASQNSEKN